MSEGTAGTLRANGHLRKERARQSPLARAAPVAPRIEARRAETDRLRAREPGTMHTRRQQHLRSRLKSQQQIRRTAHWKGGRVGLIEAMSAGAVTSPYLVLHPVHSSWWAMTPFFAEPPRPWSCAPGRGRQARARALSHNPRLHEPRRAARARYTREEWAIDCRLYQMSECVCPRASRQGCERISASASDRRSATKNSPRSCSCMQA